MLLLLLLFFPNCILIIAILNCGFHIFIRKGNVLLLQVIQLRKACSHPYLFPGIEPEPYEEGEHLVQVISNLCATA